MTTKGRPRPMVASDAQPTAAGRLLVDANDRLRRQQTLGTEARSTTMDRTATVTIGQKLP